MKAASVVFWEKDFYDIQNSQSFMRKIREWLDCCMGEEVEIVVFPGLFGCLYGSSDRYIEEMMEISALYKYIYICPGSYFEEENGHIYHSSCLLKNGSLCLNQKQIYLAKWEKEKGLSRGYKVDSIIINGIKTALIVSTDMFYPQVSRHMAMAGVDLVLAPAAIKGGRNINMQLSGLWQNVQQNLFFGVECGFKGKCFEHDFYSYSAIHGPLEMTNRDNGLLSFEGKNSKTPIITAFLDNEKRKKAVKKFDTLAQLNKELYKDIFR